MFSEWYNDLRKVVDPNDISPTPTPWCLSLDTPCQQCSACRCSRGWIPWNMACRDQWGSAKTGQAVHNCIPTGHPSTGQVPPGCMHHNRDLLILGDYALIYIDYVMLTWASLIPATRWSCSRLRVDNNDRRLQLHLVAGIVGLQISITGWVHGLLI